MERWTCDADGLPDKEIRTTETKCCRRFPVRVEHKSWDWCGEYKAALGGCAASSGGESEAGQKKENP
jgi:hypothetical protein